MVGGDYATLVEGSGQNCLIETGNFGTIDGGSGSSHIFVCGTADVADASYATITDLANASLNLTGVGNSVTLDTNSYLGLNGGGAIDTVQGSDATIATTAGANFNLIGGGDIINLGGTSGTGAYVGLIGGTDNFLYSYGAANTIETTTGTSFFLSGSGDTIGLAAYAALTLSGANNTVALDGTGGEAVTATAGNTVDVSANGSWGTDDYVIMSDGLISVLGGTHADVSGSGDMLSAGTADNFGIVGINDTITPGTGDGIWISGYGDAVDNASGDTITAETGGTAVDVSGSNNTVYLAAGSDLFLLGGSTDNDTVNPGANDGIWVQGFGQSIDSAYDDTITGQATGLALNLSGAGDTVSLMAGSDLFLLGGSGYTVSGGSDSIDTSADTSFDLSGTYTTVGLGVNSSLNVGGGNDTVSLGDDSYLGLLGGSGYLVYSNSDSIDTWDSTSFDLSGSYTTIGVGASSEVNVYGSYNSVGLGGSSSLGVNGSANTLYVSALDTVGLFGGSGSVVDGSGAFIYPVAGLAFTVGGSSDTINASDDVVTFASGVTSTDIYGTGNTVYLTDYDEAHLDQSGNTIHGTNSTVKLDGSLSNEIFYGTGNVIDAQGSDNVTMESTNNTIEIDPSANDVIVAGSYETIRIGNGVLATIEGNHDVIEGYDSSHDRLYVYGTYDVAYVDNSFVGYNSSDPDYTGDTIEGSYDTYDSGHGAYDPTSGDGDSGLGSSYWQTSGVASGAPRLMNIVGQFDLANGLTAAAAAANAGYARAQQAIAVAAAPDSAPPPSPFEDGSWTKGAVITWSFADSPGTTASPFSNYIQPQYQAAIEQAMQAWAGVAGITFQEVSDSATSDIRIGWGTFDPGASGTVGYASFSQTGGVINPGAIVRLEDPSEDALTIDPSGALSYSGTDVGLYQLALHEIGHALGLADNSDPNSVMFAELGPLNTTLDTSDIANIDALYGQSSTSQTQTASFLASSAAFFGMSTSTPTTPVLSHTS